MTDEQFELHDGLEIKAIAVNKTRMEKHGSENGGSEMDRTSLRVIGSENSDELDEVHSFSAGIRQASTAQELDEGAEEMFVLPPNSPLSPNSPITPLPYDEYSNSGKRAVCEQFQALCDESVHVCAGFS